MLPYDVVLKALETLRIVQWSDNRVVPYRPTTPQKKLLRLLCRDPDAQSEHPRATPGWVMAMKSRRAGFSTLTDAYDCVYTAMNDAAGFVVRTALIWDERDKSMEHLRLCKNFCEQLGFPFVYNATSGRITFPNGSEIVALTAGSGENLGRGSGYTRYHVSEMPFWKKARVTWNAIQGAIQGGAECTIETTFSLKDPTAAEEWARDNAYAKFFSPVEDEEQYRIPEDSPHFRLDAGEEERLRAEGFTSREAMAWWLKKCRDGYGGVWTDCFKDFPQLATHPFTTAAGRWFMVVPKIVDPIMHTTCVGKTGVTWTVPWFIHPEDTSGWLVEAVDTGHGVGADHSSVVVVDKVTRRIVCCFHSNGIQKDDHAIVAMHIHDVITEERIRRGAVSAPMKVETNGPGKYVYNEIITLGGSPTRVITKNDDDDQETLLAVKRAVESGAAFGPRRLFEETNKLYRQVSDDGFSVKGWKGPKDVSMALGWCYLDIEKNPVPSHAIPRPAAAVPTDVFKSELRGYKSKARSARRRGGL